ncbi:B-box zinc finger protein 20-like [Coffea arabica]|uniref:B-box zinc finger protein 20-like n=1 Tax=Coffea arabica TaxID=13443 RepID=A0ABM4W1W8_COFAR
MKIQCDVCDKGEASVFCVADEAALCNTCDHRVHHANKLASKHHRFSLLQPPPKQAPLCDICQERRAFLFCQQDRAILCRECDIPIHKANEHTEKHNRFLLTGVKLSENSALYAPSEAAAAISASTSLTNVSDAVPTFNPQSTVINKPVSISRENVLQFNPTPRTNASKATSTTSASANTVTAAAATNEKGITTTTTTAMNGQTMNGLDTNNSSTPTSSIAEYLIEMLPGWHVEDFLDSSSPFGFCKSTGDGEMIPFWDEGLHSDLSSFLPENTGLWVPQAAPVPLHAHPTTQPQCFSTSSASNVGFGFGFGGHIGSKDMISNIKSSRKRNDDNSFAVPQISPPSSASSKRLKTTTLW